MASFDVKTVDRFMEQAEASSIKIKEVGSLQEAMAYAVELCEKKDFCELLLSGCDASLSEPATFHCIRAEVKTMAAPGLGEEEFGVLADLGEARGFSMLRSNMREHLAGIDLAFTVSKKGIAETATSILESMSEDLRLATMISETHVIALKKSDIVPSLFDAEEYLQELMERGSAYTAFISGASRTADIERVLTIGVHGPLELHIALLEG